MGRMGLIPGSPSSHNATTNTSTNANTTPGGLPPPLPNANNTPAANTNGGTTWNEEPVLKSSWMTKRSQLKSRFSFMNYKNRWFLLTPSALHYFDNEHPSKKKEKGRIPLKDLRWIERCPTEEETRPHTFQLGYAQGEDYVVLCVQAKTEEEAEEWISLLRSLVRHNPELSETYHPQPWNNTKWPCCSESSRSARGCAQVSLTPSRLNPTDVVPPLPPSVSTNNNIVSDLGGGRIVTAVYPFTAIEPGDLTLHKGVEYAVIDDSQDHWWQVRNAAGEIGFIPSNYVKEKDELGLTSHDWCVADMSRQRAEALLKSEEKEGCFVVRNSSTKGFYTLSLFTKIPHPQVKHYHIKQNSQGFYLSEKHCCASIPELIEYHSYNAGGLASRLKCTPGRSKPATAGLSHGKWEIDPTELTLLEELGSGQFGVVRRGKWKGTIDVAVKMMKEGTMSEDDFIEEAKVMTKLQHNNLVQLYGVCSKNRPIFIITEYMKHGSLLQYLRRLKSTLYNDVGTLLDMAIQVSRGMNYLERHNYIHRDLATRNCLVGTENIVKVADFGLARYVIDDQYTSNGGTKFPIKWSPPEVFSCGDVPYGRAKNPEVVERVQRGQILSRPSSCPYEVYEIMRLCWASNPDDRPSFRQIKEELLSISSTLQMD